MGRDDAPRFVVDSAARRLRCAVRVSRLRDLGGIPERALPIRQLSLAVLLAASFRRRCGQLVRAKANMVARAASVFTGAHHPAVSSRLQSNLLLLPRSLLHVLLG